ncbi:hypothetical protein [Nocardia sp. NPDC051833]|uniref:hypothetical protein n=1 Tax=Nocardia sp. NPDC051833 TaxID=3155674 RepID=UPI0034239B55
MLTETQARESLGLPAKDPRVQFDVEWDSSDFRESECGEAGCRHPDGVAAPVHLDWTKPGFDEDTDAPNSLHLQQEAYCWQHARAALVEILNETAPFAHNDEVYIQVAVNGWYLRYATPTQVAA